MTIERSDSNQGSHPLEREHRVVARMAYEARNTESRNPEPRMDLKQRTKTQVGTIPVTSGMCSRIQ